MGPTLRSAPRGGQTPNLKVLGHVQQRVLWLATRMIHEANHMRASADHTKVGGHQASSASVVSILTALYFGDWLRAGDRVSIKPHASPVFHAIQYLLGNLDRRYLTTLREFGGLQAYPSRTKDPDPVDFSTGSVGLGAAAPLFAALADRYAATHFRADQADPHAPLHRPGRRRRARRRQRLGGDQRRDDPRHPPRQRAVDRRSESPEPRSRHPRHQGPGDGGAVPGHRLAGARGQVRPPAAGRLRAARAARRCASASTTCPTRSTRTWSACPAPKRASGSCATRRRPTATRWPSCLADVPDDELPGAARRSGRPRPASSCWRAFQAADAGPGRPTVLFAYTMKGWGLPFAGDPLNHSALLSPAADRRAARRSSACPRTTTGRVSQPDSPEGRLCRERRPGCIRTAPRPPLPRRPVRAVGRAASRCRAACRPASRPRRSSATRWSSSRGWAGRSPSASSPPART